MRRATVGVAACAAGALMLLAAPVSGASAAPTGDGTAVVSPTKPGIVITVVGVVTEGVEMGCRILVPLTGPSGGGGYLLLGGPPTKFGQVYRVTGQLQPGLPTTCQQGTPLRVSTATPV